MARKVSWFTVATGLSRAVLRVRETRRRLILYVIVVLLVMFALGNWPLAGWLEDSPVRFLFYWLGCAFLALFLFLLGLYDFLAVMREHKARMRM